ncbi:MAG: choice-of-anchor Q domain-containing protein, partial [Longimonas sp.]|uniref:beta strand repeat-containing protein n=1 Tax=Longimonas sp. TaxID=2039626 RepID=UPI003350990A
MHVTPKAAHAQTVYHVTETGDASNDGSSFADGDALSLQGALSNATGDDVIVIAAGRYLPTDDASDRDARFEITGAQDGLKIYGGWSGNESFSDIDDVENNLAGRDLGQNPTVLSGDIDGDDITTSGITGDASDIRGENSYTVVYLDGTTGGTITAGTVLDGFVITGGQANDTRISSPRSSGAGGGAYCNGNGNDNECSPQFTNIVFAGNTAGRFGGGLYNIGVRGTSSPRVINAIFTGNTAGANGGGMYNTASLGGTSQPQIINATFTRNSANTNGGAIYGDESAPVITNAILWNNTAGSGDEIYNFGATPTLRHTLIEGGVNGPGVGGNSNNIDGGDNLGVDPGFVDADTPTGEDGAFGTEDDGLRLQSGSPALDSGDNSAVPSSVDTDLLGEARIQNGTVSLGAYERKASYSGPIYYVNASATAGENDGSSFDDAFTDLQDALNRATGSDVIVIATGRYVPTSDASDRDARFEISGAQDGLKIYGGWSGGETFSDVSEVEDALDGRNLSANETILSGNIDDDASTNAENSYNVVVMRATNTPITANTVIDGVTIRDGNANDDQPETGDPSDAGGGLHLASIANDARPTLRNLRITQNAAISGGGVYIDSFLGTAAPFISNVIVTKNEADEGGGLYASASTGGTTAPVWVNALFVSNEADRGGALYKRAIAGGTLTSQVINTHIVNNEATTDGGAVYHDGVNTGTTMAPEYVNTVFWNNTADPFGDELDDPSAGVPAFQHVLAEDGCPGGDTTCDTVLDDDPQFVNIDNPAGADGRLGTPADGLRFTANAPLYNAGIDAPYSSGGVAESVTTDILGDQRIQDGTVNIGAYESPLHSGPVFYVHADADGDEDGSSFGDAFTDLQQALQLARTGDAIVVAEGIYTPTRPADPSDISEAERAATFRIDETNEGVQIYGGWNSNESFQDVDEVIAALGSRSLTENRTILSGDIGGNSTTNSDGIVEQATDASDTNSLHVLTLDGSANPDGITPATVVDGIVITGGNLSGTGGGGTSQMGAGLFCNGQDNPCSPRLSNLLIIGNNGGSRFGGGIGIVSESSENDPQAHLTNLVVTGNSSELAGGGMAIVGATSPQIINTVFAANAGGFLGAGGLLILTEGGRSAPTLVNTTFAGNIVPNTGSAIVSVAEDPGETELTLTNSILWGNAGQDGSTNQIGIQGETTLRLQNALVQEAEDSGITTEGGSTVLFLDPDGTAVDFEQSTNLDADPFFADAAAGDVRLTAGSPAIARGTFAPFESGGVAEGLATDLAGNDRFFGAKPDLGAFTFSDIATTDNDIADATGLVGYVDPTGFEGLVLLRENPAIDGGLTFDRTDGAPTDPMGELPDNVAPFTWTVTSGLDTAPSYDLLLS